MLGLCGQEDDPLRLPLAVNPQTRGLVGPPTEEHIVEVQVGNLGDPQTTAQHQREHRQIAGRVNLGEEPGHLFVFGIARQLPTLMDVVESWDHRATDRLTVVVGQETIVLPEHNQAPIDRRHGMSQVLLPFDEPIDVRARHGLRRFGTPGKEDRHIALIVRRGRRLG